MIDGNDSRQPPGSVFADINEARALFAERLIEEMSEMISDHTHRRRSMGLEAEGGALLFNGCLCDGPWTPDAGDMISICRVCGFVKRSEK